MDGRGFPWAGRAAPRDFPRASPSGNPLEQPCQPLENPVHPSSFTQITPICSLGSQEGAHHIRSSLTLTGFGFVFGGYYGSGITHVENVQGNLLSICGTLHSSLQFRLLPWKKPANIQATVAMGSLWRLNCNWEQSCSWDWLKVLWNS